MQQNIFRVQKNKANPYVMLNKEFLNDIKLSWKAKGLLAYLLSLPDDWIMHENEIVNHSRDGRDSLKAAIRELIDAGYITRERIRNARGQLEGSNYCVYEVPTYNGKPNIGKSATTNNNITNIAKPKYQHRKKDGKLNDYQIKATADMAYLELRDKKASSN